MGYSARPTIESHRRTATADMRALQLVCPDLPSLDEMTRDLRRIWKTGRVTNFGPLHDALEARCAAYLGCEVAAVAPGTTGLILTLFALDLSPGSEVVIPSFTFAATAQAVLCANLIPRFCEVEEDGNLSPTHLEELLTRHRRIGAVVPVHVFGSPADVARIQEVVDLRRRRIRVIYDAAHAFGARVGERMIGTFGDAEVFSLSATKPLVAGEGGLVASRNRNLIARIRTARNYGLRRDNLAKVRGLNGKLSELHALVAFHNLALLEERLERRRIRAARLRGMIEAKTRFECLPLRNGDLPTFKDFTIRVPRGASRRAILEALALAQIEARIYFAPPLHRQRLFRDSVARDAVAPRLPTTDALSRSVITVPFRTDVSDAEMRRLCLALRSVLDHAV